MAALASASLFPSSLVSGNLRRNESILEKSLCSSARFAGARHRVNAIRHHVNAIKEIAGHFRNELFQRARCFRNKPQDVPAI
jgi:hypothetical protein